jgi:hypothetical protein
MLTNSHNLSFLPSFALGENSRLSGWHEASKLKQLLVSFAPWSLSNKMFLIQNLSPLNRMWVNPTMKEGNEPSSP